MAGPPGRPASAPVERAGPGVAEAPGARRRGAEEGRLHPAVHGREPRAVPVAHAGDPEGARGGDAAEGRPDREHDARRRRAPVPGGPRAGLPGARGRVSQGRPAAGARDVRARARGGAHRARPARARARARARDRLLRRAGRGGAPASSRHARDAAGTPRGGRARRRRPRPDRARGGPARRQVSARRGARHRPRDPRAPGGAQGRPRGPGPRPDPLRRALRRHARGAALMTRPSTAELLRYFLYLGSLGFGGPVALIGYMQRDLVERRRWFTREESLKSLALSQLAPGPPPAQLAICLGNVHSRVRGATLVSLPFVLPSFLMTVAIGWLYVRFGGLAWMQAAFYGVGAAVIGIITIAAWKLA